MISKIINFSKQSCIFVNCPSLTRSDKVKRQFPNLKVCGFLRGESGKIGDQIGLGARESCLYRINPESDKIGPTYVHLHQTRLLSCRQAEMYIIQVRSFLQKIL
mgnify:CR=1 FL=1